ncbi:hypothetical protein OF83DRAFT_1071366 [Amylostereum chailletii]|nr:hypothetical protein OF83DRAFT_1071366 [Amylostereum chailletii]
MNADITDSDIPHRTKVTDLIYERFCIEYRKMVAEMQNCPGRISFTTDVWSDPSLNSFMAVTAHYFVERTGADGKKHLAYVSQLIAFRHVPFSHSGENLAEAFLGIIKPLGIVHKVRLFLFADGYALSNHVPRLAASLATMHRTMIQ